MTTALKLGPADHGRKVSEEDLRAAEYQSGYRYEIIDGRLYVSHWPEVCEVVVEGWLHWMLHLYAENNPNESLFVSNKSRVVVPGRQGLTVPGPDLAVYWDFPFRLPLGRLHWQDISPGLIVEVVFIHDPEKDFIRNVELYAEVPSIKEYWIIDIREDPEMPTLLVHQRQDRGWQVRTVRFGETYVTSLLPGFQLLLNPRG